MTTVVEVKLSERSGGCAAETVTFETVAAVSGDARELAVVVGAAGSAPYATGPVGRWWGEGAVGVGWESEATFFKDGVASVGLNGWPDGEGTVVDDGEEETAGVCGSSGGDEEEEEEGGGQRKRGFTCHCVFLFLVFCR